MTFEGYDPAPVGIENNGATEKLMLGTGKMLVPDDAGVSTISASAISTGVKAGASVSSG
jgi:hypothetical protein